MQIVAGDESRIDWENGTWVFLDMGFANQSKSCGLLVHDKKPEKRQFTVARAEITKLIKPSNSPINLVIEAPLSVCFDERGNPKGRSIEKCGSETRYWYSGPGCSVMVGALYLLRSLLESRSACTVQLFEAFISFKKSASDHLRDVKLMREVVQDPDLFKDNIISPTDLKIDQSDQIESAFKVAAMDTGVPPVIRRDAWSPTANL
jgi:hypothetical protein